MLHQGQSNQRLNPSEVDHAIVDTELVVTGQSDAQPGGSGDVFEVDAGEAG